LFPASVIFLLWHLMHDFVGLCFCSYHCWFWDQGSGVLGAPWWRRLNFCPCRPPGKKWFYMS
jgi:hypothetical protein